MITSVRTGVLALAVVGCAVPPRMEPVLNGLILDLHSGDLRPYRVAGNETVRVPGPEIDVGCGHEIRPFVIDSAGQVWNF